MFSRVICDTCTTRKQVASFQQYLDKTYETIARLLHVGVKFKLSCTVCISYNTGRNALPDIYTQCLSASGDISGKAQVPVLYVILYKNT